jgi:hypothetical protein
LLHVFWVSVVRWRVFLFYSLHYLGILLMNVYFSLWFLTHSLFCWRKEGKKEGREKSLTTK